MTMLDNVLSVSNAEGAADNHTTRCGYRPLVTLAACLISLFAAIPAAAQTTTIVDVGSGGILPNCPGAQTFCYSVSPAITPDARYIAFQSTVPNLVAGPASSKDQIYVHDRESCSTTRISQTASGQAANGVSGSVAMSASGRIVAFESSATNLVSGIGGVQIYAYDTITNTFELVSRSDAGVPGDAASGAATISADGRWIAYVSQATNLVPGDTNAAHDVFLYDRNLRVTQVVSRSLAGVLGDSLSNRPNISGNGRFITFDSLASNLDPAPTNNVYQSYLLDRDLDGNGIFDEVGMTSLTRVSVNNAGQSANGSSTWAVATDDGLKVAFSSDANNLVPGDTNAKADIFIRHIGSGQTTRESVGPAGLQTTAHTYFPLRFSANGQYLTFNSTATQLAAGLNGRAQIFRRDLLTGVNDVVSRGQNGQLATADNQYGIISADGQTVFFDSAAGGLVPGSSADSKVHIYARDFQTRIDPCGITPNAWNDKVIPINGGNAFDVTTSATTFTVPVVNNGEIVVGVSFKGTVFINPFASEGIPAETQLTITNPDLIGYVLGGVPPIGTPWDFQNQYNGENVTYRHGVGGDAWGGDGLPDFALPDAPSDGNWNFTFTLAGGISAASWSAVTITLHTMAPATINIQPAGLQVTTIPGGSEMKPLSISNIGGMNLDWEVRTATSACTLPAWVAVNPTSGMILPGAVQISNVLFNATGLNPGVYESNLCIGSNDAAHPLLQLPLQLVVGAAPAPELMFDPARLDFSNIPLGQSSAAKTVTLRNTGTASATGIVFQNPGSGFSIVSSTCGSSLAAAASCTSAITFTPTGEGPAGAIWRATSSQGAMAELALTGNDVMFKNGFE